MSDSDSLTDSDTALMGKVFKRQYLIKAQWMSVHVYTHVLKQLECIAAVIRELSTIRAGYGVEMFCECAENSHGRPQNAQKMLQSCIFQKG